MHRFLHIEADNYSPLLINTLSHTDMFFFFQAEDGIRDLTVTGVQTCALPICAARLGGRRHGSGGGAVAATPPQAGRNRSARLRMVLSRSAVPRGAPHAPGTYRRDRKSVV